MPKASKNLQRVMRPYYVSSWSYKEIRILPKQNGRFIDAAFVFEQEEEAYFTNLGLAIGIRNSRIPVIDAYACSHINQIAENNVRL